VKELDDEGSDFIDGLIHQMMHNSIALLGSGGSRKWACLKKLGHWDMLFNDIFLPTLLPLCHE
jgi:hypothetical protein